MLDDLGLIAALEWHAQEVERRSEIKVHFHSNIAELQLPMETSTGIFRIYQEVLTNAVRHANAHKITSSLSFATDHLNLAIEDDGKGMDLNASAQGKTLGLLGIKERTFILGGSFAIDSSPGNGTRVQISIPYQPSPLND
jgi:signal transduction histidine kinase